MLSSTPRLCAALSLTALAACDVAPTGPTPEEFQALAFEAGAAVVAECVATRCTRLNLDGYQLEDYSVLNDLTHVTALMVSYSNFDDLADIAGMTQLTELHIGGTGVTALEGLSAYPNLTLLHVQAMYEEVDITPEHSMTGLTELAIDVGPDGDIGYIAGLTRLRSLQLERGVIADLSPLAGHPSIETLIVTAELPDDVSALEQLPSLRLYDGNGFLPEETRARMQARGVEVNDTIVVISPIAC